MGKSKHAKKKNAWKKEIKAGDEFFVGPRETDIIIPIMGPTGSGKSTFINTLIGQVVASVGHDVESHTAHIQYFAFTHPNYPNRRIVVLDTPGFDDTNVDDHEILRRVAVWLARSYEDGMRLAGVIYLHEITQARMLGTARTNLDMFYKMCGKDAIKNVIIATTKWSDVPNEVGERREGQLQEEHMKFMLELGSSMHRFDNTQRSARHIVNSILTKEAVDVIHIQRELVEIDNILAETDAGRTLRYTLQDLLDMQKSIATQLRKEEKSPELAHKLVENEEKIRSTLTQIKALNIPLSRKIMRFLGLL
ncbi:hypothetical protein D9615_003461 [Tricholomella constricta]|uniref:G domain-containing protein n=1 Tax=Tricholomella constricta TaxID=117010 RepID=A0A8H5HJD2_9AGAR|nr:hypothetical protein D9615_003461 [Tricholomella constricta]